MKTPHFIITTIVTTASIGAHILSSAFLDVAAILDVQTTATKTAFITSAWNCVWTLFIFGS